MRSSLFVAALVIACASTVGRPAAADRVPSAEKAAEPDLVRAKRALAMRNYSGAAEAYEAAFRRVQNHAWLFNAASAWHRHGDLPRAASDYARYLNEAPNAAPLRTKAKKELASLASKLGQIEVRAEGASAVTMDGEAVETSASPLYVLPGQHAFEARFGDATATQSVLARAGEASTVVLAAPAPAPVVAAVVEPDAPPKPEAPPSKKPLPPLVVWIGAGVTVLAGGLTVLSGLDVESQKETFDAERTQENLDSGKDKQLRTNVLLAVTGVTAVFTGVAAIWLVDWKGRGNEAHVKVGAGPGSFVLRGSF